MKLLRTLLLLFALLSAASAFSQSRARSARHKMIGHSGEILAYSDSFDPVRHYDELPEMIRELLRSYQTQPRRYATRQPGPYVAPLLQSTRTQEPPYNGSAPFYTYDDGTVSTERCLSGCVATALEQVVSFWRHPAALQDTLHGWTTDHYVIPDVLPGTKIDWDHILPNYSDGLYTPQQAQAIADLTYYLGVAVHMNWGLESSGASLFRAVDPLYDAFDFRTVAFVQRGLYTPQAWNRLLRHELECGRPIVYTGHTYNLGGHCFNIDGVDEDGFYHVNWGEDNKALYLDLDYMNPFEPINDMTGMGMQTGMFNNQTALFMHPDDFEIDIWDTLSIDDALHGVDIERVTFSRQPDLKGFVRADFSLTNRTQDSLNYTFEVFTYLPTDTAVFEQADYVGLTSVNLAPGEHRVWPVYCRFNESGERIFGCSTDDETIPFRLPVNIVDGVAPIYQFGEPTCQLLRFSQPGQPDDVVARISFEVSNQATAGGAADLYTYCLFPEGSPYDTRHFNILQLMAGETHLETVDFHHLRVGEKYRFLTRQPWTIRHEFTFEVRPDDILDAVSAPTPDQPSSPGVYYDLYGRSARHPERGVFIRNGRKVLR